MRSKDKPVEIDEKDLTVLLNGMLRRVQGRDKSGRILKRLIRKYILGGKEYVEFKDISDVEAASKRSESGTRDFLKKRFCEKYSGVSCEDVDAVGQEISIILSVFQNNLKHVRKVVQEGGKIGFGLKRVELNPKREKNFLKVMKEVAEAFQSGNKGVGQRLRSEFIKMITNGEEIDTLEKAEKARQLAGKDTREMVLDDFSKSYPEATEEQQELLKGILQASIGDVNKKINAIKKKLHKNPLFPNCEESPQVQTKGKGASTKVDRGPVGPE